MKPPIPGQRIVGSGGERNKDREEGRKGKKRTKGRAVSVADGARMIGEGESFG